MSQCNSEGVAEFIRLITELIDLNLSTMSNFEQQFLVDNFDRAERYGDRCIVSEEQLDIARSIYKRYL